MTHRRALHPSFSSSARAVTAAGALAVVTLAPSADAANRYALEPPNVEAKPAYQYARMSSDDCLHELDRRGFPYRLEPPTKQVDTPLRFAGPIHGVRFKLTERAMKDPEKTVPEAVADCRLAIAIDDLAQVLAWHDVVEVEYMSMYRRRGVGFVKPGKRHPSARAIDITTLKRRDGSKLTVLGDWHGLVGQKTCGEGAAKPRKDTPGARELRSIVCETADQGSFNLMLSPHYDWGHRDHFHFEVRSDIRWFLIQ